MKQNQYKLLEVKMSNKTLSPSFDEIREILKEITINRKKAEEEIQAIRKKAEQERAINRKKAEKEMREIRAGHKEFRAELKEMRISQKQMFKEVSDRQAKNDRDFQKTRNLFETQWGRLVESLVEGNLLKMLNERGIEVQQLSQRTESSYKKKDGKISTREIDIMAVNGDEVVAVEVKSTLTPGKVKYFINTLKDFKKYFRHCQHLTIYGAVAYLKSESKAHLFAQRQGLFVIRATGDSASLINTKDFKPKAFA